MKRTERRWRWRKKISRPPKNNRSKKESVIAMNRILTKTVSICLAAAFALGLSGCGAPASAAAPSALPEKEKTEYTVGLIQLVQHPSLDEIRTAITDRLTEKQAQAGIHVTVDYQNGQGDAATINTICQKFVADEVDLIIAIATPAAQAAAAAAPNSLPVIFSAVSDPVAAGLVENPTAPEANITGTSDAISPEQIFSLASELTAGARRFGLLYCTGEDNSASVIADAKAYLEKAGLSYQDGAVTAVGDVQTAVSHLVQNVDAIFIPIDNTIATAMPAVADIANKAKIPVYVSADSMVADGGLATVGVNYTKLGQQTADMALKALTGTPIAQLPVRVMQDNIVTVNAETAKILGVDVSKYKN